MARSGQAPSIDVGADVSAEISVALGGNSGLAKTGAGQLTLSGANAFTGPTTINSGTLALKGAGQVGNVSLADQSSVFDLSQISAARLSLS
jgi:autotransporter-associated beta strand protein